MSREEIIRDAIESMHKGNEKLALETIERALAEGYDPVEILSDGFSAGIREVGDLFSRGSVFLPQLMMTADVMQKVSARVDEAVASGGQAAEKKGIMVLATVEGDVHDIGKGIVASLVKTQGIEVIDLGRDVPVATIVEKAQQYKADIIGTSALLTTTMNEQKKLEELLKSQGLRERFKTMIGGAPATQRWADRIGADAYAEDAGEAVTKALALLS
ncbi:MAG: corrinoid protein [Coriobacteriales bacterium]|nr:corrinoid protein [Coriobacteriales bacterium]